MYCRKTFEALLDEKSPVKPFSLSYEGEKCDLSNVPCKAEKGEKGKCKRIYEVIPGVIRATLEMTVYPDFPVIEYTPYLENISGTDSGILSEVSVLDYEAEDLVIFGEQTLGESLQFGNSMIRVRYHLGAKASGADFLPQRRDLFARPGSNKLELENASGWCSTDFLPFFAVDNDAMNGINLALGWSGSWKFSVEKEILAPALGAGKTSRIRCGMRKTSFRLHPGEKVMQPSVLIHFREGKSIRDAQNEFRRFMIAHYAPRNSRGELLKPPISFMAWGGQETDKQLDHIKIIREKHLPYETHWIDAGWMGSPGPCPHFLEKSQYKSDWPQRVGSWDFNTWAHPHGLKPISDAVHGASMRLLVWFEALRVHSQSGGKVLTEHPEWLLPLNPPQDGASRNFLYNLGIPEAREALLETISGIMEREGIDDYREDFNMDAMSFFTENDAPDRAGITEMKFVEGFFLFWEGLRKKFPDMFIDNCAGGGRRLNYKSAAFSFPLCQSDFACYSTYEVECVQLENQILDDWLPLHGTLNWGEEDLYHAASGMGGGYSTKIWQYNGREPKEDHDYEAHRKILEWGRMLRDMHLAGDVYPLVESPEQDFSKWNGQQIHDPQNDCGMVQIYRRKASPDPDFQLDLTGLKEEAVYETEFFTGERRKLSGKELKKLSVHLELPRSFQFLRYRRIS